MQKETEETIVFFVTFLSLVAFQLGRPGLPVPPWLRLSLLLKIRYLIAVLKVT